jgi:hypothetical protein
MLDEFAPVEPADDDWAQRAIEDYDAAQTRATLENVAEDWQRRLHVDVLEGD